MLNGIIIEKVEVLNDTGTNLTRALELVGDLK